VGAGSGKSIINAVGLANGIYIDGIDAPNHHVSQVVVTGFTVENANFEGILVTNASFVTIRDNEVINNDLSLNVSVPACALHLVQPVIVCQVRFTEWTREDRLRYPVFLGIREDKNPTDVGTRKGKPWLMKSSLTT
jgi:ATP-dependent DNA ligase